MASHPRAFNAQVWQRWVPLAACPRGAELSPVTRPGNLLPGPLPSLGPQAQNPGRERSLGPLFLWGNLLSALSPVRSVTSEKGPVEPSTNSPSGWQGRRWGGCLAGLWPARRERHVCTPHPSCRHALEERGNPALCTETLCGSGRLMWPPLSTPPQPSQQPLALASPKPAPLRVFDVSGNGPLPLSLGPQPRQQEASLGQCRLCAWCPLLVSLGCCSGPPCPGHQHSVPALPSGCSPPHRPSFYLFLLSPGIWVAGGLHVFRFYPPSHPSG